MEQGAPSAAGPAPRLSRPPAWIVALAVVIAYITLITGDTYLGPVPLKLFLVAGAMTKATVTSVPDTISEVNSNAPPTAACCSAEGSAS